MLFASGVLCDFLRRQQKSVAVQRACDTLHLDVTKVHHTAKNPQLEVAFRHIQVYGRRIAASVPVSLGCAPLSLAAEGPATQRAVDDALAHVGVSGYLIHTSKVAARHAELADAASDVQTAVEITAEAVEATPAVPDVQEEVVASTIDSEWMEHALTAPQPLDRVSLDLIDEVGALAVHCSIAVVASALRQPCATMCRPAGVASPARVCRQRTVR